MRLVLGVPGVVDIFQKRTLIDLGTSVTDIRNFKSTGADFFKKIRTMSGTVRAELTILRRRSVTSGTATYFLCPAGPAMFAGIIRVSRSSGSYL